MFFEDYQPLIRIAIKKNQCEKLGRNLTEIFNDQLCVLCKFRTYFHKFHNQNQASEEKKIKTTSIIIASISV